MTLSKHYLDRNRDPIPVDLDGLRLYFSQECPKISFVLLMGSAKDGMVAPHSDLDIAMFYMEPLTLDERLDILSTVSEMHRGVRCDLGVLNQAEPVYCYEALKGRLLFAKDEELWLRFYSVTCRKYESQMFHYRKQRDYRLSTQ